MSIVLMDSVVLFSIEINGNEYKIYKVQIYIFFFFFTLIVLISKTGFGYFRAFKTDHRNVLNICPRLERRKNMLITFCENVRSLRLSLTGLQ